MRGSAHIRLALCALVVIALALRVFGIQYGLPSVYNPDEVAIMARALTFAKGTLNPHNFLYPTFYFYVLFAWVGAYLGLVWLTGGVSSVAALQELYFTAPTGIYTAGRLLTALLGTLCVPAVFLLGRRLFDARVGLAAATFLAVAPLAVRDSHYVKHDIPATLAIIVACIAIARIWPSGARAEPRGNAVLTAAAACGIAFSTHYYCVFLALPLAWAILGRWQTAGARVVLRQLFAAALTSAVVFFALSPFLLVEPIEAMRDITANRQIVIDRAVSTGAFTPMQRYLEMLWSDAAGRAVVALAAAGAGWLMVAAPARGVLVLLFPISFLAFITNTSPASRYLNPLLPFVALLAGWTLASLANVLRAPMAAWAVAVLACAVSPFLSAVRSDRFFRMADTRAVAEQFIKTRIASGATILIQPYSVVLNQSREGLVEALTQHLGGPERASKKFQLQLALSPYPAPAYRLIYLGRGGLDVDKVYVDPLELGAGSGLRPLRRLGVTYVVLKRYNDADPEMTPLVAELSRHGRLIAAFSPFRQGTPDAIRTRIAPFLHNTDTRIDEALERPGPPLEIWQLDAPDP